MTLQELEASHTLPLRVRVLAQEAAVLVRRRLGPGVRVLWYGSWVRGRALPHSDIDLAVHSKASVDPARMGALRAELEDMPTLYEISVVDLGATDPGFREEVIRSGAEL